MPLATMAKCVKSAQDEVHSSAEGPVGKVERVCEANQKDPWQFVSSAAAPAGDDRTCIRRQITMVSSGLNETQL